MSIHKASWEQPAHQHPSRHGQSHTCVTHNPISPATGVCVWQGGMEGTWAAPTGAPKGTSSSSGTASPSLLIQTWGRAHSLAELTSELLVLLPRGCSNPASNPSHSFSSRYHPHSQIFEYMCWNDLTIMALAKIWCCFDWMWFKLPSAGLYFSGPILKTMFPLTVTLIHMKIKQAE